MGCGLCEAVNDIFAQDASVKPFMGECLRERQVLESAELQSPGMHGLEAPAQSIRE